MELTLPRFDQSKILIIGDIMLDRYWHSGSYNILQEVSVPVIKIKQKDERVGGAGNVALNLASLGACASIVSVVGNDPAATSLRTRLESASIHYDFQVSTASPTTTKLRIIGKNQQLLRLDFEESFTPADASDIISKTEALISDADVVVLSDYMKGSLQQPEKIIQLARESKIPVLVDPKGTDFSRYRGATLVTPNLQEFEAVVGPCTTEQEVVEKGQLLMERFDFSALLVTRSEHGMTLLRQNLPELHLPARAREVFDVTGAGDTVIAVLAAALGAGFKIEEAVALSNTAAGLVVAKLGTATVSLPELRRAIQAEHGSECGVVSEDQLLMTIEDARAHGEKIVFTNGCFDIIHAGHVEFLEKARQLGDRLVIAVNDDASVVRLKGEGRPINPCERRKSVLAGLEAADWVTSFSDDTPERLLELIKPDILVKGGDYTYEEVVGWQIVEAYGGQVKVLEYLDNCSTTDIVKKILSE